jgi:hypothetical protein
VIIARAEWPAALKVALLSTRLLVTLRAPLFEGFGYSEVVGGVIGLDPAQDHRIVFGEFIGNEIAGFEAQAFPDLLRDGDLTFGREFAVHDHLFDSLLFTS